MPSLDSRRVLTRQYLSHLVRHLASAWAAADREQWCTVQAHLREIGPDARYALKEVAWLCENEAK